MASVDPAGPAPAELRVGDEIIAINGHDVTDGRFLTFLRLVPPPPGTTLELTTGSGRTLGIVAR